MRTGRNNAFNHLLLHTDIWVSVNGGKVRGHLLSGNTVRTRGSASSSGVIFLSRKSTGLPSSPARFGFLLVNLLSPSWLFSMDCLNVTIESVHSYIFLHSDKIMMLGSKGLLPPFDLGIKIIIVIRYLKVKGIPRELRNLSILMPSSCFLS